MSNLPQNVWRRPMFDFPRSIDELFDVFDGNARNGAMAWKPATDIVETDEGFELSVELPGIDPERVDVTLDKRTLHIKGEKSERKVEENSRSHRTEIVRGSFERSFTFGVPLDEEGISARFDSGVLTVTVKKAQAEQPRRIEIQRS